MNYRITSEDIKFNLLNLPQIVFEVTDNCNLNCQYCGYSDFYEGYDKRSCGKLPFAKVKLVIDYLHNLWKNNYIEGINKPIFISFYGGEPLLNIPLIRDTISYLNSLEKHGKIFYYSMTTNAVLLHKHIDFIVKNKIRLLISLDGDEYCHSYRVDKHGNNSFFKVFENVKLLQKKHPSFFKKYVMFNSVLHNRNSAERVYNFIFNSFNKVPTISQLNDVSVRKDKKKDFLKTYQNLQESINLSERCDELEANLFIESPKVLELAKYIHFYSGNVFNSYNDLFINKEKRIYTPTGTCSPFSKKMFITATGRILQCEKIDHKFSLGSISRNEIVLDLEAIAVRHNQNTYKYFNQCENCILKSNCSRCIYQLGIDSPKTYCDDFWTQNDWYAYESGVLNYLRVHPSYYSKILSNVILK